MADISSLKRLAATHDVNVDLRQVRSLVNVIYNNFIIQSLSNINYIVCQDFYNNEVSYATKQVDDHEK